MIADRASLRVLVADDEPLARSHLCRALRRTGRTAVIHECADGDSALDLLAHHPIDVAFLDVQMPRRDGLSVAESLPAGGPAIIFATAFDEYAIRALRASAVDYLLKPVDDSDLAAALLRAEARVARKEPPAIASGAVSRPSYVTRLTARRDGRTIIIDVQDIERIASAGNYAVAYSDRGTHMLRATLTELDAQLDPRTFARVHRSAIVNLTRVREIQTWFRGEYLAVLASGARVRIGATHRDDFFSRVRTAGRT